MKCQKCGTEHNANFCPNCGASATQQPSSNFRQTSNNSAQSQTRQATQPLVLVPKPRTPVYTKWWFWVIIVLAFFMVIGMIFGEDTSTVTPADESSNSSTVEDNNTESDTVICNIGDTLNANGLKITYQKVEDWTSDNMFVEPEAGNKFIRVYFVMENTNSNDYVMGGFDFQCYADNAKMEMSIFGDNQIDLYSTISSGRKLEGYIYFEVPTNASTIEIEYETNFWTDKKAIFKVK